MSKIKELQKRATIAWSSVAQHSDLIVAGTAAGTIGLDFDTSSQLEIYGLDIHNDSPNLALVGQTTSNNRFHKIVWGQAIGTDRTHGIIAGGMDNGAVTLWDPAKIIAGKEEDAVLGSAQKHQGAVHALDFNPYQHNLLASGATDSEIYIWDLSNPSTPTVYSPGTKTQQSSDVSCVAWNKKVPHILASATHTGVTFIWDLKAKRSIFNFTDANKSQVRAIAWNPNEATQVLTASEDDQSPILQLWDLRNIYTPIRKFLGHRRGIWGVSWCPTDTSLLLSCGKDNRTLCWDTDTAEVLCEVEAGADTGVWNVDVQWSPRTTAVLSTSSLEGKVSIYTLQDVGERNVTNASDTAFGVQPTAQPVPRHAPSWLRRPAGVAFGFGGNLASFSYNPTTKKSSAKIRKVVTEKDLLDRSERLEEVVSSGASEAFEAFCDEKIASATVEGEEKYTWKFLKVLFDKEGRHKILDYLGFDEAQTAKEVQEIQGTLPDNETTVEEKEDVAQEEDTQEEKPASPVQEKVPSPVAEHREDPAEEVPTEGGDSKDVSGLFGANADFPTFSFQQGEAPQQQQQDAAPQVVPEVKKAVAPRKIAPIQLSTTTPGPESAITKALLIGNFSAAVDLCVKLGRLADALVLAACGGEELWAKTQARYFALQQAPYTRVMASIVRNDLEELVSNADLADWKAALSILCTYAKSSELPKLATILGDRLDNEAHNIKAATLCYICAGSIDKTVNVWIRTAKEHKDPHQSLQDLIEKVSIFRHAVNASDNDLDELLARKYGEYAEILASQGRLPASLRYLSFLSNPKYSNTSGAVLLDRVFHSLKPTGQAPPQFPFSPVEVGVYKTAPIVTPATTQPTQPAPYGQPQAGYPGQFVQQQQQQQQQHMQGAYNPSAPAGFGATGAFAPPTGAPSASFPPTGAPPTFPPTGAPPTFSNTGAPPPAGGAPAFTPGGAPPTYGNTRFAPPIPTGPPVGASAFAPPGGNFGAPPGPGQYTVPPPTHPAHPPVTGQALPPPTMTGQSTAPPPFGVPQPTPPPHQTSFTQPPSPTYPPKHDQHMHTAPPPVHPPTVGHVPPPVVPPTTSTPAPQPVFPPTTTTAPPPNPVTTTPPPSSSSASAPAPAASASAPVPQNPDVDVRYVVDSLNRSIATPVQGREKAKWDDMTKRLPSLITALEKGEHKAEVVTLLVQVCRATESGDHAGANKYVQDLGTSNLLPAKDLIGVKRFVEVAKAR